MRILLAFLGSLLSLSIFAQNPFGNGIVLNTSEAFDGYILFENNDDTYLMNNCGEILNKWDNINQTDNHTKLLENGNMMFIRNESVFEVDWDGNIVNNVAPSSPGLSLDYEVVLLPDSNYLCVTRRDMTPADFDELGYDIPGTFPSQIDGLVELDRNTGEIVWEWNIRDHVIQERDSLAANYGVVAEHPELFNMDAINNFDWSFRESFMINSMDYNPERDEIIVSVRKMCEVVIIDHSTTTEEAAGHTGGRHGKGGDILYRWGNPGNYGAGVSADELTENDQFLFYQHNPHWVTVGPHTGKIMMYNNGIFRPGILNSADRYSTSPVITPPIDENDRYVLEPGQAYGPVEPDVEFRGDNPLGRFYSAYTSGAQILPNGNVYITEGQNGRLLEITPDGRIVFEYFIFDDDYIFRSIKYDKDHPAFEGRDMTPMGTLESPPSDTPCSLFTSVFDPAGNQSLEVDLYHQPSDSEATLINPQNFELSIKVIDVLGNTAGSLQTRADETKIDLSLLPSGSYVIFAQHKDSIDSRSFKIIKL